MDQILYWKEIEEKWTWKIMAENYRNMFHDILQKIGLRKEK